MTPKLRLSEADRKPSLSDIEKFRQRGIWRTNTSTQMMDAPMTQARRGQYSTKVSHDLFSPTPLMHVMIHPRVSLSMAILPPMFAGNGDSCRSA
jgi:hypothetical protein